MNVVDTSAIVAILFDEAERRRVERTLLTSPAVMSAATWVELSIVVEAKTGPAGAQLLDELMATADIEVVAIGPEVTREALIGWRRFGKGRHRAGLNFGDVFSYGLARHLDCPLLFVGDDFSHTDVQAA